MRSTTTCISKIQMHLKKRKARTQRWDTEREPQTTPRCKNELGHRASPIPNIGTEMIGTLGTRSTECGALPRAPHAGELPSLNAVVRSATIEGQQFSEARRSDDNSCRTVHFPTYVRCARGPCGVTVCGQSVCVSRFPSEAAS